MSALDLPDEVIEAFRLIRATYPNARSIGLSSFDQACGFRLTAITLDDGLVIDEDTNNDWPELSGEIDDELGNVSWGTFGDTNADVDFAVGLATGRIIRPQTSGAA